MSKRKTIPRRLEIPITQEVINAAIPRHSGHCVIADSIRAAVPGATRVSVDLQTIRFTLDGTRYVWLTPAPEQSLLVGFDQGHLPEPRLMALGRPIQRVQSRKRGEGRSKREVSISKANGQNSASKITVEGGRLPPTAALSNTAGRRRSFGLKQLKA